MLIDFHTHSTASDGALTPRQLIDRARARGIEQFAITDHDTMAGFVEASAYYTQLGAGMILVPGVEFSCRWSGLTIHIVGLDMDWQHPAMESGLARLAQARRERGEKIAERLDRLGFAGALPGALSLAGQSQLGRPHFAQWLVDEGHVDDVGQAFDKYLGQGKTGDVKAFWPELAEVTRWIVDAGGIAIIAHPLKYRLTGRKLGRLVVDFKAAGGEAIEVNSGRQTRDQVDHLLRVARTHELRISVGSDFHRDAPYSADLGIEWGKPASIEGVWKGWSRAVVGGAAQ